MSYNLKVNNDEEIYTESQVDFRNGVRFGTGTAVLTNYNAYNQLTTGDVTWTVGTAGGDFTLAADPKLYVVTLGPVTFVHCVFTVDNFNGLTGPVQWKTIPFTSNGLGNYLHGSSNTSMITSRQANEELCIEIASNTGFFHLSNKLTGLRRTCEVEDLELGFTNIQGFVFNV